ncbi:MAG: LysR family transcriptional regulator [Coxiellaceae bacterium]|nr:LysR family transcriptional regulator [Coxiellaceae bacterium]
MLDWITCVKTFQNIVDSGSFTKTAKNLYTTPSAISKRINWLEDTLGVPLFHRSTRKVTITEAGQALYERSVPLLNEWNEVKQSIKSQHHEPNGVLKIGVPIGFGSHYVVDILPEFMEKYPNIKIDLKLTNCVSALNNQQIDLFITKELLTPNSDQFHKRRLFTLQHQLYASPSYIKKHGKPKTIRELKNHNCLCICGDAQGTQWDFGDKKITVNGNLKTNNTTAAIKAAVAGLGIISMCPEIIYKEIEKGQLISLFPDIQMPTKEVNAFYPKQKFIPKKTLAFVEHLERYFKK